jgi:formylglycine-generating enzyme required for sulfatase activity
MTDCGTGSESCCTTLTVSGGTFYRTYANSGTDAGNTADPATVSTFRLDKYEVTVGRFRRFVAAWNNGSGWLPPAGSGKHTHLSGGLGLINAGAACGDGGVAYESGWDPNDDAQLAPTSNTQCYPTWTASPGTYEDVPINCRTWYDAYAFCIWDGGFLPSQAEWEYAAAGGSEQREYPWGSAAPGTANQYAIYACFYPNGSGCADPTNIAPVGTATAGAGAWGQLDLAGNVLEWNLDGWGGSSFVNPCSDCANLTPATYRVDTGGAFNTTKLQFLRPSYVSGSVPDQHATESGFRCARAP